MTIPSAANTSTPTIYRDYVRAKLELVSEGNTTLGDNASVDTLTINAIEAHNGASTHNGTVTCNSTLTANGNVNLGNSISSDTVTVTAIEVHQGAETHNNACTFNGGVSLLGTTNTFGNSASDKVTVACPMVESSAGTYVPRTQFVSDADKTVSSRAYSRYWYTSLSASRSFTVDFSGANAGEVVEVFCKNASYPLNLFANSGAAMGILGSSGHSVGVFSWTGSAWVAVTY